MGIVGSRACETEPENFYQFCLDPKSVKARLADLGFEVIAARAQKGPLGFDQEVFDTKAPNVPNLLARAIRKIVRLWEHPFAHSYLIVARKKV